MIHRTFVYNKTTNNITSKVGISMESANNNEVKNYHREMDLEVEERRRALSSEGTREITG